jgi:orotate phosphoribosyltransferase
MLEHSSYYFDKYRFETQPAILRQLRAALAHLLFNGTQRIATPELGAMLLGGAVSLETGLPMVIVRKGEKDHGGSNLIEVGEAVTLIEDVIATGGEALRAVAKLKVAGLRVLGVVAVIDREEGGAERIGQAGLEFWPLFRKRDLPIPQGD